MLKQIITKESKYTKEQVTNFMQQLIGSGLEVDEVTTRLLLNRNIDSIEEAVVFLEPSMETMHSPWLLKDMYIAIDTITKHIDQETKIVIYGDYDVDGITSTTILYKTLKACGAKVDYYIPDRLSEGYGINKIAITNLVEAGAKLIISVDTGITAVEQAEHALNLGCDIIITDHHECQEILPKPTALINPKQPDCGYPFDMLAGVGVTYKLCQALGEKYELDQLFVDRLLEIVAVGTVADLVPLVDENRTFVYQAFQLMKTMENVGLKALSRVAGIDLSKISAGTIGFQIGPRLNAAGRLGDAKRGVSLFLAEDDSVATEIAESLDIENKKRQKMEEEILRTADELIQKEVDLPNTSIIVVAHEGWHHGVIGIVASRIVEKYYRPTILLAIEDGVASGSARSVEDFSIFDALMANKSLLDKFGGHEMAAGMSLDVEKIPLLRKGLNEYALEHMDEYTLIPKVSVDDCLSLEQVSVDFIETLERLEPYGMGNGEPKFMIYGDVSSTSLMGKDKNHFKMFLKNGAYSLDVISFYGENYYHQIVKDMKLGVIGTLNTNEWKGVKKAQLFMKAAKYGGILEKDIREAEQYLKNSVDNNIKNAKKDHIQVSRNNCVLIYKGLKRLESMSEQFLDLSELSRLSLDLMNREENHRRKISLIIRIFDELELLTYTLSDDGHLSFELNQGKKVELDKSTLYNNICCD